MDYSSKISRLELLIQEKNDENERLRVQLAASEDASKFKQKLHQTLSGAINIGYWEWDEITERPAYLSSEMAAILGMSPESLYEKYQCEEDFFPIVHPDDLQLYIDNLSVILDPDRPLDQAHKFH